MRGREFLQYPPAARGKADEDLAVVGRVFRFADKPFRRHPAHQSDGAVMPYLQTRGELSDGEVVAPRGAAQDEHGLVLLRGDTGCQRRVFAEVKEIPERMAECGQMFKVGVGDGWEFGVILQGVGALRIAVRYEKFPNSQTFSQLIVLCVSREQRTTARTPARAHRPTGTTLARIGATIWRGSVVPVARWSHAGFRVVVRFPFIPAAVLVKTP